MLNLASFGPAEHQLLIQAGIEGLREILDLPLDALPGAGPRGAPWSSRWTRRPTSRWRAGGTRRGRSRTSEPRADGLRWGDEPRCGRRPRRLADRPRDGDRHRHRSRAAVPEPAVGRLRAGSRRTRPAGPATRPSELDAATGAILSDLVFGPPDFDVEVGGEPVLDEREQRPHARRPDRVRRALDPRSGRPSWSWSLAVAGARRDRRGDLAGGPGRGARTDRRRSWSSASSRSSPSTRCSSSSTGSSSRPGSYTFDPATERLVQLFPFQFWEETATGRRRRDRRRRPRSPAWLAGRRARRPRDRSSAAELARARSASAMSAPTALRACSRVEAARDAVLARGRARSGRNASPRPRRPRARRWPRPVVARVSLPPWANSAMDGYAIRAADTRGATRGRARRAPGHRRRPGRGGTRRRRSGRAPRPGSRPARRLPTVPTRSSRSSSTTPLDAAGRPGAARPRRDRPAPGGLPRPRGRARGRLDPRARAATCAPGRRSCEPGTALTAGRDRPRRRRRRRAASSSIAARASASSRPATRSARPASRSARPGSPTPTARACARSGRRPPAARRSTSGIAQRRPRRRPQAAARRRSRSARTR